MAGFVLDDHRMVRNGPVQHCTGGVTSFGQLVVVVALADEPLPLTQRVVLGKANQPVSQVRKAVGFAQVALKPAIGGA